MTSSEEPGTEDAPFLAVLEDISRSLGSQVSLAGGFLTLHPKPPPGFRDSADRAVAKLQSAVDEFLVDVARGAASERNSLLEDYKPWPWISEESGPEVPFCPRAGNPQLPLSSADTSAGGVEVAPTLSRRTPPVAIKEVPQHQEPTVKFCFGSERGGEMMPVEEEREEKEQSETKYAKLLGGLKSEKSSMEDPACVACLPSEIPRDFGIAGQLQQSVEEHVQLVESGDYVTNLASDGACTDWVLNPNWSGRLCWDFTVIAVVLVDTMVLPYQMAYKNGNSPDDFDTFWLLFTTSFFALDLISNFFTAYTASSKDTFVEPGRLVTSHARIARHYLRGWFTIDFVSTVPWSRLSDMVMGGAGGNNSAQMAKLTKVVKFVRFLRLMRMLRLAKLGVIWERIEAKMGSLILLQVMALVRVLFIVITICHWNACIWWMVGQPESLFTELLTDEDKASWEAQPHWTTTPRSFSHDGGEAWSWIEKDTAEAYVFCFYWTLGVMRTMPSEVQPVNLAERIYVMLFMFFAVSAFAISVTLITQAFMKIGERKRIFNEDMAFARMQLRNISASEQLQSKVKAFLVHLFNRRRVQAKEAGLFSQLPLPLTKLMKYSSQTVHLRKMGSFADLPKRALYLITEIAEARDLIAGERVSVAGCIAQAAWIVVEGQLRAQIGRPSVLRQNKGTSSSVTVVDEECLHTRKCVYSQHTVVACTCAEVIVISKKRFLRISKDIRAMRQEEQLPTRAAKPSTRALPAEENTGVAPCISTPPEEFDRQCTPAESVNTFTSGLDHMMAMDDAALTRAAAAKSNLTAAIMSA